MSFSFLQQRNRFGAAAALAAAAALYPALAWAAGGAGAGASEGVFIAQLICLLLAGRGLGELLERMGQPAVMGQLIAGILLGPSLFGWLWPSAQHALFPSVPEQKSMIDAVSQLGILMLLLLTGMETDLKLVRKVGAACFSISTSGVVIPFALGFTAAQFLPDSLMPAQSHRVVAGLFLGTALSISSVKIVAMVVREMGFMRRNLGQVIVSSAIIEDTIGWVIIAITLGIASQGRLEITHLAGIVLGVGVFMLFSLTLGRRIVFALIRWTNDTFRSEFAVITVILIVMGVMALITNFIGVHTVLGAFVAGILVGESPILSDHIEGQLRGIITALFMPVFFGMAGLSADLTVLVDPTLALLTAGLVLIASLGKFSGAFLGAEIAGLTRSEGVAVGCGMNARGSTEVIVATIGLSMNVLSHTLYTMVVTMAVITTLAMPPTLRWALRRLPLKSEEKERLEREEMDMRGFVARLQRLLVVVDDSVTGKFASYLAGLIGGGGGMPTTVLHVPSERTEQEPGSAGTQLEEVKRGAKASAEAVEKKEDAKVEKVHLTSRSDGPVSGRTVAQEARKGYDLLILGLARSVTAKGGFSKRLNELAAGFDGPLCLVLKATRSRISELGPDSTILVPVNGTEISRRGAELALAIGRTERSRVRVLYVSRNAEQRRSETLSHRREEAVLKDIVQLAERYGVEIETSVRARGAPGDAIYRQSAKDVSVIVMGVARRSGEELLFGETATSVLEKSSRPVILLSDELVRRSEAEQEVRRSRESSDAEQAAEE
ncbi:cation:proton antiporter [Mesorhizobium sp. SP-1A]|uniref:cation:proton antiporter domain-containing protein n=1 Tax=Mesorhizobium sp. SP-1A TaxID=3077840 RepID=UPI0028F7266C|nr:cation:proton antiporter [Mesorhizobium sp. SP-1A]